MKAFLRFAFLSGIGWALDMLTYTGLLQLVDVPNYIANFVSSYVGVTFVWFTSLKAVFQRGGAYEHRLLLVYWAYQFLSILAYSQFIVAVAHWLRIAPYPLGGYVDVAAKILITPVNLVTNFLFMRYLMRFLHREGLRHD